MLCLYPLNFDADPDSGPALYKNLIQLKYLEVDKFLKLFTNCLP